MTDETPELATELAMEAVEDDAGESPAWHRQAAFTTVVVASLAAISALFAGITAHELILDRTEEIVELSVAASDRIRAETLEAKHAILTGLELPVDPDEAAEVEAFATEAAALEAEAAVAEEAALEAASNHLILAVAATILGISIAVIGLAIIVSRRWLWAAGGFIAATGTVIMAVGLVAVAV